MFKYLHANPCLDRGRLVVDHHFAFSVWVWIYLVIFVLSLFGVAQFFPIVFLLAFVVSVLVFILPFFGRGPSLEYRLVGAAVSFGVLITALYPPVVGFFMGLQGGANPILVKILLGVRSSFYSLWVFIAFFYASLRDKMLAARLSLFAFALIITFGLLVGGGGVEPRITYLLNSFLSLFSTLGVLYYLQKECSCDSYVDVLLQRVVIIVAVAGCFYFPVLMMNLGVFRPDLALMHQTPIGRGVDASLPPQWQSLLYGYFVPRFVGTFPNPILYGYFCAISAFVFYFKRKYSIFLLLMILSMVTISKGAVLLLISAIFFDWTIRRGRLIFAGSVFFVVASELALSYLLDGSNRVHLRGLIGGFQSVVDGGVSSLLYGFGMGSGGNLARAELVGGATSEGWLASGSESGIGSLVYQLGFFGLSYFSYLASRIVFVAPASAVELNEKRFAVAALCSAWFANMLLQEDLINVTVSSLVLLAVFMIVSGGRR